jgi:hypothetical protein
MGAALELPNMVVLGILTPAAGGIVCGLLLAFIAPRARGSGIPQVKIAYAIKGGQMPFREAIAQLRDHRQNHDEDIVRVQDSAITGSEKI